MPLQAMARPVKLGGGPLASFFVSTTLYCCEDICPSWCVAVVLHYTRMYCMPVLSDLASHFVRPAFCLFTASPCPY